MFLVTLFKQPEAAAMHILRDQSFSFRVCDPFGTCDAGCGNIDTISFEVKVMYPKLKLKKLVLGKVGMARILVLDERFEEVVKYLIGEEELFGIKKYSSELIRSSTERPNQLLEAKRSASTLSNFPWRYLDDGPSNELGSN
jgi:hypothetical protein